MAIRRRARAQEDLVLTTGAGIIDQPGPVRLDPQCCLLQIRTLLRWEDIDNEAPFLPSDAVGRFGQEQTFIRPIAGGVDHLVEGPDTTDGRLPDPHTIGGAGRSRPEDHTFSDPRQAV